MWVLVSVIFGISGHELPTSVLFFGTKPACEATLVKLHRPDGSRVFFPDGHSVAVIERDACVPAYGDLDAVLHPNK